MSSTTQSSQQTKDYIIDLRCYSRQFVAEFIELYRNQPSLWQIKNKEYRQKNKKKRAYDILIEKLREVDPNATKETALKKINSLRTCYRKELKKVLASLKKGESNIYTPSLWYFNLLTFLQENDGNEEYPKQNEEYEDSEDEIEVSETKFQINLQEIPQDPIGSPSESYHQSDASNSHSTYKYIQKRVIQEEKPIIADISPPPVKVQKLALVKSHEEYESFGKHIAEQMRQLSREQAIYLTKIINDGVFEAQLEQLTKSSKIVNLLEKNK